MAYNTNKSPLEYLYQRMQYYEKQERKFIGLKKKGFMGDKYSEEDWDRAINKTRDRILEFKEACEIIAQHQKQ